MHHKFWKCRCELKFKKENTSRLPHFLTIGSHTDGGEFATSKFGQGKKRDGICMLYKLSLGARCTVVGGGTMLQAGRPRVRDPMRSMHFFQFT
jgi:hypothetical protein